MFLSRPFPLMFILALGFFQAFASAGESLQKQRFTIYATVNGQVLTGKLTFSSTEATITGVAWDTIIIPYNGTKSMNDKKEATGYGANGRIDNGAGVTSFSVQITISQKDKQEVKVATGTVSFEPKDPKKGTKKSVAFTSEKPAKPAK